MKANKKTFYLHRAVAIAFILNPENKREINHIDGDKTNNNISNIVWASRQENMRHAWDSGLMENARKAPHNHITVVTDKMKDNMRNVSRQHRRKLSDEQVKELRKLYESGTKSKSQLAKKYNLSLSAIGLIISRQRYADVD